MKKLLAALLAAMVLTGCATGAPAETATEMPAIEGTPETLDYTLYLPDQAPLYYTHNDYEAGESILLEEIICTNTTQISVKNCGDIPLTCNLYYPDDTEYLIQTHTIQPGKTGKFGGLTSRFTYCLGFHSEESGIIDVKIKG
ncbi:MAG: hypothetical protein J6B95_05165 [Oscillospiraceae bacterium]|nr:hypothetical protein [Oscillospiraceae bacterium]